jgi:hypothetical protein
MPREIGFLCFALTVTALLALAACQEGESVFDLEVGDCIVSPGAGAEEKEVERVRTVDCSELHDGEVVALFDIEGDDFPGEDALFDMALEGCPSEASTYLYPTEDSWNELGDRQITCILASLIDLAIGDCLNYPPEEAAVVSIERRDCEDSHDARVIDLVEMPGAEFPGDDAIAKYAAVYCPEGTDEYLGPTSDSWEHFDDRQIVCLEE